MSDLTDEDITLIRSQAIHAGLNVAIDAYVNEDSEPGDSYHIPWSEIEAAIDDSVSQRLDPKLWCWRVVRDENALTQPAFDVLIEQRSVIDRLSDLTR